MIGFNGTYLPAASLGNMRITAAAIGGQWVMGGNWLEHATQQAIIAAFGAEEGIQVISLTNDYLNAIAATDKERAQQLAMFINEDPMLICSLVETSKERWLTIPQGKNDGYCNGVTLPYYWADLGRIDMNVQWLPSETSNGILWFNCWNGTILVAPYWGTSWTSGFTNVAVIGDTDYRNEGERSISFTCSDKSNYAHILGWDSGIAPIVKATHFSIYATDKTTKLMELVPFISQGEGVFLDLLSGTIIRNNDKGSFTIALTPKAQQPTPIERRGKDIQ